MFLHCLYEHSDSPVMDPWERTAQLASPNLLEIRFSLFFFALRRFPFNLDVKFVILCIWYMIYLNPSSYGALKGYAL